MEYYFSKLDENDLPIILKMARTIISNDYISFLDKNIVDNFIASGQCDNAIIENMQNCITIKLGNQYIGFSIILENKIHLIMVDNDYRNKKYGTNL